MLKRARVCRAKLLQSVWFLGTLRPIACQAPLSMDSPGQEPVAIPSGGGASQPRNWTQVQSCLLPWQAGSSPLAPHGKPLLMRTMLQMWCNHRKEMNSYIRGEMRPHKREKKNSVALRVFLDLPNFLPYLHGIFSSNFSLTCNTSYWKFPRGTMLCVISVCSLPLQL